MDKIICSTVGNNCVIQKMIPHPTVNIKYQRILLATYFTLQILFNEVPVIKESKVFPLDCIVSQSSVMIRKKLKKEFTPIKIAISPIKSSTPLSFHKTS